MADFNDKANEVTPKGFNYTGSFRFCEVFEEVLAMCASVEVKVEELISYTFLFEDLDKAIQYAGDFEDLLNYR